MIDRVSIKQGAFKIDEVGKGQMQTWGEKRWYLGCPRCGNCMALDHKVTVTAGNITVEPSVGCSQCKAHILIKDSKIQYLADMN